MLNDRHAPLYRTVRDTMSERWKEARMDEALLRSCGDLFRDKQGRLASLHAIGSELQDFCHHTRDAGFANALGIHFGVIAHVIRSSCQNPECSSLGDDLVGMTEIGTLAITELGAGASLKSLATSLTMSGGQLRLTGGKWMISMVPFATVALVAAKSRSGMVLLWVPLNQPGVAAARLDLHTIRTCPVGTLQFSNVPVNDYQIVAAGKEARQLLRRIISIDRTIVWQYRLGRVKSIYELLVAYASQRYRSTDALLSLDPCRSRLAMLRCRIEVCELLIQKAGQAVSSGYDDADQLADISRIWLGRLSHAAVELMTEIMASRSVQAGSIGEIFRSDATLDTMGGGTEGMIMKSLAYRFFSEMDVDTRLQEEVSRLESDG